MDRIFFIKSLTSFQAQSMQMFLPRKSLFPSSLYTAFSNDIGEIAHVRFCRVIKLRKKTRKFQIGLNNFTIGVFVIYFMRPETEANGFHSRETSSAGPIKTFRGNFLNFLE